MDDYLKQDFFENASTDSMTWLENAEFLKISADSIFDKIITTYNDYKREQKIESNFDVNSTINRKRDKINNLEDRLKSFSNTYYLLIGYSFENLIKGLSIKNNPQMSFNDIYSNKWSKYKSGHGISGICRENIINLTSSEIDLLQRLETYIIWIGKYPVAKKLENHINEYDNKYFDSDDKELIDNLFDRVKNRIIDKR
ncbi:hypothetical protein D1164_21865 [Mariniphaga sediminis]|uniref:Uncharacterized protein n=1 Tax=Mariniphaga sediminis TaxID=1628158 RepID=A0A399CX72_9BACT|nr:hypothetical protein [Mariniphaga sediminis]RIH63001.1 hypothetical protein D1164_21865 [Mariniphaga sediminis]